MNGVPAKISKNDSHDPSLILTVNGDYIFTGSNVRVGVFNTIAV
jgi:hypothetical protein